ncbi:unnamed protein product [Effrenium voratum]|uniref:Major facilitator superfamily (MFS) profile domain-containing protein n=1 Tax=Effrenium voratum TaxID=2562239 RepID=A0AA36IC45_9DINO|nr:unnamed protein product [Effrenium voratum]
MAHRDVLGQGGPFDAERARRLMLYISVVTIFAFAARALPGPFLPIVMIEQFKQRESMVGVATAAYPMAALLATPFATSRLMKTKQIMRAHCLALMLMAGSNAIMSSAAHLLGIVGPRSATLAIVIFRMLQGIAFAYYMGANTTLITRIFPKDVSYIVALVEVFVGVGAQLGRLFGGVIYDAAGFAAPFLLVAGLQAVTASIGFLCFGRCEGSGGTSGELRGLEVAGTCEVPVRWSALLGPRVLLGMFAVFLNFFQVGFYDTTLSPFLKDHLELEGTTTISVLFALRSLSYLSFSYFCGQLMRHRAVSFEVLILCGATCCTTACILIPLNPDDFSIRGQAHVGLLLYEAMSLMIGSAGPALLFIPSLPIMQHGVRHLGTAAIEQTTTLFMAMMSIGEAIGPILGGWLVQSFGFQVSSAIVLMPFAMQILCSFSVWLTLGGAVDVHEDTDANAVQMTDQKGTSRAYHPFIVDDNNSGCETMANAMDSPSHV